MLLKIAAQNPCRLLIIGLLVEVVAFNDCIVTAHIFDPLACETLCRKGETSRMRRTGGIGSSSGRRDISYVVTIS